MLNYPMSENVLNGLQTTKTGTVHSDAGVVSCATSKIRKNKKETDP